MLDKNGLPPIKTCIGLLVAIGYKQAKSWSDQRIILKMQHLIGTRMANVPVEKIHKLSDDHKNLLDQLIPRPL